MFKFCIIGPHKSLAVMRRHGMNCVDAENMNEVAECLRLISLDGSFSFVYITEEFFEIVHRYVIEHQMYNRHRIKPLPSSTSGNVGMVRDIMMSVAGI